MLIELLCNLLVVEPLLVFVQITAQSSASPPATSSATARQQPRTCSSEQTILLRSCDTSSARPSSERRAHAPHDPETAKSSVHGELEGAGEKKNHSRTERGTLMCSMMREELSHA